MDYVARSPAQLGQILRNCRKLRGLSQQLAAQNVGLEQSTVSTIELDSSGTQVETLHKLLSALGLERAFRFPRARPARRPALTTQSENGDGRRGRKPAPAVVDSVASELRGGDFRARVVETIFTGLKKSAAKLAA